VIVGRRPAARRSARTGGDPEPLDERRARLIAADLLSRRGWTCEELTRRLRRRGAPAEVAAAVIADLLARGHLDDAAFARHWVAVRAARGYGGARLRAELSARGVTGSLIEAALADLDAADALARARTVALRRFASLRGRDPVRAAARLRDHLLRRGFSAPVVARVVRDVLGAAGPTLIE
jgi:regulatory protein